MDHAIPAAMSTRLTRDLTIVYGRVSVINPLIGILCSIMRNNNVINLLAFSSIKTGYVWVVIAQFRIHNDTVGRYTAKAVYLYITWEHIFA